jgi:transposase InsO family protein
VAVAVDQFSRAVVGFAVFPQSPTSKQVQSFLHRAIRASGSTPKYVITDKGTQFWCRSFKTWCSRRAVRPRYGAIGQPASIAVAERFVRSMKQECTRCLLVPMSLAAMRRELSLYAIWFNAERPHMALAGKTPQEARAGRERKQRRLEPRPRWTQRGHRRKTSDDKFRLYVTYVEGRKHLPVIELRRAA